MNGHLISSFPCARVEVCVTVESNVKLFSATFNDQMDKFIISVNMPVINDPNQRSAEASMLRKIQDLALFRVPTQLCTLGRVVAHVGCGGTVAVSHHSSLIGVLVGSLAGMVLQIIGDKQDILLGTNDDNLSVTGVLVFNRDDTYQV